MVKELRFLRLITEIGPKSQITFGLLILLIIFIKPPSLYSNLIASPQSTNIQDIPLVLPPIQPYPEPNNIPAPLLSARSAIVVDAATSSIMYQKNPDAQLLPASTTKIMTALIALENYDLNDTITIVQADDSIGHSMHLIKGEQITVENLLYGILVESGNDAAFALARNFPGGYSRFVDKMNQKASELNLHNTQFRNVSGVEQEGHYSSVRDLSFLARAAMKNQTLVKMVATKNINIQNTDSTISHSLVNINELLGVLPGMRGIKTGWTENAGECLVASTVRDGKEIITVILDSQDRFGETTQLVDWAYTNHTWQQASI